MGRCRLQTSSHFAWSGTKENEHIPLFCIHTSSLSSNVYTFQVCLFSLCQIAQLGEKRFENPQTANLHRILVDTIAIHELMTEGEAKPLEQQQTKTKQVE